jgi:hypothetical protein
MTTIHVPRPSKNAMNPDRAVSSLLLTQIHHLKEAEKNLPLRHHSGKYIKAIQTEREAAEYIRHVTEAIHKAHGEAAAQRAKHARQRKKRPSRKLSSKAKAKSGNGKRRKD